MKATNDYDESKLIFANGINGSTREWLTPPMSEKELVEAILQEEEPEYQDILDHQVNQDVKTLGVTYGIDPKELSSAGWGVIYGSQVSDEIKEALSPLVELRMEQAGELFKRPYNHRGEGCREFLVDNDTGFGPADPEEMPYYLLIVGSPDDIPYSFQYELDVDRAVGRIFFNTIEEYDNYARSVVAAEKGEVSLPRQASFFSVANPNDNATNISTDLLIEPLFQDFKDKLANDNQEGKWDVQAYLRGEATRSKLTELLGGVATDTPAFLLTSSHGMGFNRGDKYQAAHQGALVCQDWDGDLASISEDVYFAGENIANDAQLHGMISFFFACYGAGTPAHDEFMYKVEGKPKMIANSAFLASLPRRMLSHPRGGALAVIGHIERAWTHSFKWAGKSSAQRTHFTATLGSLFDGYPIGHAFDYFNARHARASVELVKLLSQKRNKEKVKDMELIQTWMVNNDARDYIILGDPAVRLCVSENGEQSPKPSSIQLNDIDLTRYRIGAEIANKPAKGQTETKEKDSHPLDYQVVNEEEAMAIIPADLKEQVKKSLQNVTRQVANALQNLSSLEVLTYLSDDDLENVYQNGKFSSSAKLKAVTLIALDGDIKSMIPARKVETLSEKGNELTVTVEVDEELLKIHKDMVELAQANRTTFFKNLAEIAVTLANTRL